MLISIIIILCAFTWLIIESDFLRVRLPIGKDNLSYAGECKLNIYNCLKLKINTEPTESFKTDNYDGNNHLTYQLVLSPNVKPMCYEWLIENYAKLVNFKPRIELDYGTYRQQISFNGGEYSNIMRQIMKIHDKKFIKQLTFAEV